MVYFWVVRDKQGVIVEMFDIGLRSHAEQLMFEYQNWFKSPFYLSCEMHHAGGSYHV